MRIHADDFIDNVRDDLNDLLFNKMRNMRPYYVDVALILHNSVVMQFETEGKRYGTPWAPLAPATIKERKRLGFVPIRILRRHAGAAGLLGSIQTNVRNDGVNIFPNVEYARQLHFGKKWLPPRPFFPSVLPQEDLEDMADAFIDFWEGQ